MLDDGLFVAQGSVTSCTFLGCFNCFEDLLLQGHTLEEQERIMHLMHNWFQATVDPHASVQWLSKPVHDHFLHDFGSAVKRKLKGID